MRGSRRFTDAAFVHLSGIQTFNIGSCDQTTITDAAFVNLRGIQTLDMSHCTQTTIMGAAIAQLAGINKLKKNTQCRRGPCRSRCMYFWATSINQKTKMRTRKTIKFSAFLGKRLA